MKQSLFFILIIISFHINNCSKKEKVAKIMDAKIGQELLFIEQEYQNKNYESVIDFIDKYFDKTELDRQNIEILFKKGKALEKLTQKLNKKFSKKNIEIAEKYGLKVKDKKFYYNYKEFKSIWEKFPDTETGKKSFEIWAESVDNIEEKILALESYISKTKKDKEEYQLKLADIYIQQISKNEKKYREKLINLYDDIYNLSTKNYYRDLAFISKNILLLNIKQDLPQIKDSLENFKSNLPLFNSLKYYLLGELAFKENNLQKSYELFKDSLKSVKKTKGANVTIPALLGYFESFPDNSYITFEVQIQKKTGLVELLLKYNKNIEDKKIAIITGKRVRVRRAPVIEKKNIINSLNYGEEVVIIEKSEISYDIEGEKGYWYKVQLKDGTTGWIFGKYLSLFLM